MHLSVVKNHGRLWYIYFWVFLIGRHTGENIKVKLDETVDAYGLTDKVSYVVSDNAANMAKAFSTSFPSHEPADVDGPELWMDNEALIEVGYIVKLVWSY